MSVGRSLEERVGRRRRLLFTGLVLASAALSTAAFGNILGEEGFTAFEMVALVLYGGLMLWIGVGFWTALLGFFVLAGRRDRYGLDIATPHARPRPGEPPRRRCAVLMPVYNEDPARSMASLRAAFDELKEAGVDDDFDFWVLSDSRSAEARLNEALLFADIRASGPPGFRLFYRWRRENVGRKSGNIAEWCRRWGSRYDYMVVYDADSVIGGQTLSALVAMMDRYPKVGIIQSPPVAANRRSLFARTHQFAASAYGPIFNAGQAFWCLGDANYVGHNAIIRTEPFMRFCGLAPLPGDPPLGGEILSHDFVEAGLMRRGGYQVRLAYGLGQSYEEPPPSLIDYAKRDRRWCQGNMQHLRLLGLSGLRPITRLHFLFGGLSYMSGGIWMAFLGAMLLNAAFALPEGWILSETGVLVPHWPLDRTGDLVMLFGFTCALLLLPKLLSVGLVIADRRSRTQHGGGVMPLVSALVETVASVLTTPILLMLHLRFVIEVLFGRAVGWQPQQRGESGYPLSVVVRAHLGHTGIGAALALLTWYATPSLFWWFSPIFTGLLLAIPVSAASGSVMLGRAARRLMVFRVPTENRRRRPAILRRFDAIAWRYDKRTGDDLFRQVLADPLRLRLVASAVPPPVEDEAEAVAALRAHLETADADALDPPQALLALADPEARLVLHRREWLRAHPVDRAA